MRVLELKIPPPAVALLFAVAMWLVPQAFGAFGPALEWRIGLGVVFAGIGQAISISSHALPFLGLPVFVGYITQFQIKPEERILASMFGAQFTDYARRVRRWA